MLHCKCLGSKSSTDHFKFNAFFFHQCYSGFFLSVLWPFLSVVNPNDMAQVQFLTVKSNDNRTQQICSHCSHTTWTWLSSWQALSCRHPCIHVSIHLAHSFSPTDQRFQRPDDVQVYEYWLIMAVWKRSPATGQTLGTFSFIIHWSVQTSLQGLLMVDHNKNVDKRVPSLETCRTGNAFSNHVFCKVIECKCFA